ncbi:MAG: FAD-binding protein, partial [Bacteroidota bacterium]
MSLTRLFFSFRGRIARGEFWYALLVVLSVFTVLSIVLAGLFGLDAAWPLYPPLYWALLAVAVKRYHDIGRSGLWLLLLGVPIIGPAWVIFSLGFRKGHQVENRFGPVPALEQLDYFRVGERGVSSQTTISDVTGLVSVEVAGTLRPATVPELRAAVAESSGPISIGGGRFSMGGQIASPGSLHIDMRGLNAVIEFAPRERRIRVQAGIRWCDIQRFLDPHDLSVKIMQTYANFTVGGSLSVNSHGRYVGLGPVILSVQSIALVTADGMLHHASPGENSEMFYAAVGGYGALGVIVEAELDVVPNARVACATAKMPAADYTRYFRENIRNNSG